MSKSREYLETNNLSCQNKRTNEKVLVLNARPPDTGRIFFRTKLRGDKWRMKPRASFIQAENKLVRKRVSEQFFSLIEET